ncbi:hypothetical protein GF337_19235 [candidate division KSB1 bacterium]|nr:hypothetical protein [candidate division KSB1 bacterium]
MTTLIQPQILSMNILCPECKKPTTCSIEKKSSGQYITCEHCDAKWMVAMAPTEGHTFRPQPFLKDGPKRTPEPFPKIWFPPEEIALPIKNIKFAGRRMNRKSSLQSVRKGLKKK